MSETTMLRYRIDSDLKANAEDIFESMGLTPAAAIKLFYKQTVIRRKLPFQPIAEDPFRCEENQKVPAESTARLKAREGRAHYGEK